MPDRDPNLPHQIVLMYDKQNGNAVRVTCNCLRTQAPNGGSPSYDFMPGVPKDTSESWAIYDDPSNHNETVAPFYTMNERLRGL